MQHRLLNQQAVEQQSANVLPQVNLTTCKLAQDVSTRWNN